MFKTSRVPNKIVFVKNIYINLHFNSYFEMLWNTLKGGRMPLINTVLPCKISSKVSCVCSIGT